MRKFMLCAVLLLAAGALIWAAVYVWGFYIGPLRGDQPVEAAFRTEGRDILRPAEDGGWEVLAMRGVDLSASQPGNYATSYAADEEDYLRWLTQMAQMGANTVRVSTVMDDDFYNALYRYNEENEQKIYLFQGIQVSDEANYGDGGIYSENFLPRLIQDGKDAVDIIHGRKTIALNELRGSGNYRRDISPWVIGYQVGSEWVSDTVAYADHSIGNPSEYQGAYVSTAEGSTPFEALLAQVMDEITAYETEKYRVQRVIGFVNSPDGDFLRYEDRYARQLQKVCWIDAEHIAAADTLLSGLIASYRLYDYCDDFTQYLESGQRAELAPLLEGLDSDGPYGGYLHLLARYHTMPVVVSFGISSARGAIRMGEEPLTEREQGERLLYICEEAEEYGIAGVVLATWQDEWERRSWNTAFSTVLTENYLWHDVQSDSQNYGLMAFEPGEEPVCIVDGDAGEWSQADRVLSQDGLSLSMRWDAEGLYLLVQGEGAADGPLYIPIDTTQLTGSSECDSPSLRFERAADFVLCIDGKNNTRLLVQERYNPLRANFLYETEGRDPYIVMPSKETTRFSVAAMAVENNTLVDTEIYSVQEMQQMRLLGVYETGCLVYGNGDPDSEEYHSLADFCFGEGCAEIRIPWQLLNVGSPAYMQIHGDYYTYYGIEYQSMSTLWLGLYRGDGVCAMFPADIDGYGNGLQWRERLKQSYFVIQQAWKGEEGQ